MSDDARRKLVIEAGFTQFLKHGYAGTTMDDVAEQAHISKRTIYELFPSKKELFIALVVAHRQTMLALPRARHGDLSHELEQIFGADASDEAEQRRLAFGQVAISESRAFPEVGEILYRHGFAESVRLLADWLAQRRREGLLDVDNASDCARLLIHMVFAPRMPLRPHGPRLDGTHWRKHLRQCIRIFLNGVRPRPGEKPGPTRRPTKRRVQA